MEIIADKVALFKFENVDKLFELVKKLQLEILPYNNVMGKKILKTDKLDDCGENIKKLVFEPMSKNFLEFIKYFNVEYDFDHRGFAIRLLENGIEFLEHTDPEDGIVELIYLNDDYDGGELILHDYNITFKPEKGDIIIFDASTITHSVLNTKIGQRYSIISSFPKK